MTNFNKPELTSTYTNFITELKARDNEVASLFSANGVTTGSYPARAIRWNATNSYFERRNAANNGFERLEGNSGTHKFVNLEAGNITATSALSGASVTASGQVQGARFNVTGTTAPANGFYLPAANEVRFTTNSNDRFTIESNGECGIGTVDPQQKLHVTGNVRIENGASASLLEIGEGGSGSRDAEIRLIGDTARTGSDCGLRIIRTSAGSEASSELIHRGTGQFIFEANEAADMLFKTSNLTRMIIDSGGAVCIGDDTSPDDRLHVKEATNGAVYLRVQNNDGYARFGTDQNDSFIAADVHNFQNRAGSATYLLAYSSLFDIKTAAKVNGGLQVTSGLTVDQNIQPSHGNADNKGINFAQDIGGGSGDKAYIRYYAESGEDTRLLIGIENDSVDDIYLSSSLVHTSGAFTVNGVCTATSFSGSVAFSSITGTVNAAQLNGLGSTASGNRWGVYTPVNTNGVMEIGKILDFHTSDGSTTDFSGRFECDGNNFYVNKSFLPMSGSHSLGSSSAPWQNLYINDLNMSNKGKQNDVDGTWGDYTIQEGHEDLYLINHRTNKKFKFALIPVA